MEVHYVHLEVATEYVYIICVEFAIQRTEFHIGAYVELIPNAVGLYVSAILLPLKI
jgi:hypothetical protein